MHHQWDGNIASQHIDDGQNIQDIHKDLVSDSVCVCPIQGPDNPTRQLLPIMSTKCCSGNREGRKDKGGGGGSRSKTKLCVCVTKLYVKDGVWQRKMVWRKMVCDKAVGEEWCGERWWTKVVCERWSVTVCQRWCVTKWCERWCVKDDVWQSGVYTQTDAFTHQTLLHTNAFTHRVTAEVCKIAVLPQFLAIEPHFVRNRCRGTLKIAILLQFLAIEPHFVRKGCRGGCKIAILPQFLAIEPHIVRKGCRGTFKIAILPQFWAIEPRFVRKGCVSCRLVGTVRALREK